MNNTNEVEDLYCLTQCDDIIMSNSSFSWGEHGLGKKKKKIISPDRWFGHCVKRIMKIDLIRIG